MSLRNSYEPGTPSWMELAGCPDVRAAETLYRDLLGWEIPVHPDTDRLGGYRRARLGGRDVAGVSPVMQDGQPCEWNTYVSVEDAEVTIAKVRDAGGAVVVGPLEVPDMGRMAIFTDPAGAPSGIWEPGAFAGAEVVDEDGACAWNELATCDVKGSREFYGSVFGWTVEEREMGGTSAYHVWRDGEESRGGMIDLGPAPAAEARAHWLVCFAVPDADRAIAAAARAGGEAIRGPVEVPVGRLAVLRDPQRALFAVIEPDEELRSRPGDPASRG